MLKIRTAQEESLADEDFVRRLVAHIQARSPTATAKLTYHQLRVVARHGIAVARTYDLRSERDLAAFTFDMLAVNPQFHRQRELHGILKDPNVPVAERMDRVTAAPDESWTEAGKMTDAAAYWQAVLDREPEPGGTP